MSRPLRIHCVHTAAVHEATFAGLFAKAQPAVTLVHTVRPDWLVRARAGGLDAALSSEVLAGFASAEENSDAVLLTCSTLGPLAASASSRVVRIDMPLMRSAARHEGVALLALCLESTRVATAALFEKACAAKSKSPAYRVVLCSEAWAWFEIGDLNRFAASIADAIRQSIANDGPPSCIVLAQASMTAAEPLLVDIGIPVYSSPKLAVAETLRVAGAERDARP